MRNQGVVLTEDEESFLQEGSSNYAAALLALSEFRRRVAARLQNVLDEFSLQLDELGLPTAGFKIVGSKLEDQDLGEQSASIGLRKNCGGELYSGCFIEWDFSEAKGRQLWVSVWLYPGRNRAARNRLFNALQTADGPDSASELEQDSDGTTYLTAYCDPQFFYNFDTTFRTLLEGWIALLTKVEGGLHGYLPTTPNAAPGVGS